MQIIKIFLAGKIMLTAVHPDKEPEKTPTTPFLILLQLNTALSWLLSASGPWL